MGSGGSHALWPVTHYFASRLFFKRFGQRKVHDPDLLVRVPVSVYLYPGLLELVEGVEPLPPSVAGGDVTQTLPPQSGDGYAGLEPAVPLPEAVLAAYPDVGAALTSGLRLLAAEDLDEQRSLEEKGH